MPPERPAGERETPIRVALAEDHVLLREGISRLVAANEDFEVVGALTCAAVKVLPRARSAADRRRC